MQTSSGGATGWNNSQISSLATSFSGANNTAVLGIDTTNGSFTYSGDIGDTNPASTLSLIKLGANTLTLTGFINYTGATTVSAGVLQFGSSLSYPIAYGDTAVLSGGTLDVDGQSPTINGLNGAGVVNNTAAGTATLTIGYNNDNGSFSGVIRNTGGSLGLVKTGNGLETLTGVNTFTGPTAVSSGTLAGNACTLPTAITLSNGANVAFNQNVPGTVSYPITGNGSLTMAGTNILNLAGSASWTGPTTISGGTLEFSSPTNQALSGNISGGGLLEMTAGTMTLSGSNVYTGGTTLSGGLLSIAALSDTASSNLGVGGILTLSGGTLQYTGTGTSDNTTRTVNASNNAYIQIVNAGADLTLNGNVNNGPLNKTGPGTLSLGGGGDNVGLALNVLQGTVILEKTSSNGVHAIGGGGVTVSPGALLQLAGPNLGGNIFAGATINGTFDLNGRNEGVTGLGGNGTVTNSASSSTSTLTFGVVPGGNIGGNSTFPGVLTDGGAAWAWP